MPDVRFRAPAEKRTCACDRRRARDGAGENHFFAQHFFLDFRRRVFSVAFFTSLIPFLRSPSRRESAPRRSRCANTDVARILLTRV